MKQRLYSLVFANIGYKFLALVLACLVYWGTKNEETKNINNVPVKLILHDDLVDTNNKDYKISLEVKGSKDDIDSLTPEDFEISLDVSDQNLQKDSTYYVQLKAFKLYGNRKIKGVKVTNIKDKGITLYLQKNITVSKKIEVKFQGNLNDGLKIYGVSIDPPEVGITGPKNIVDSITEIKTEPVPLTSDINDDFEYEVNLASIKNIELNQKKVTVHVRLVNKSDEKKFNNCKLSLLNYADKNLIVEDIEQDVSVTVEGPPNELTNLDSKDIITYLDISSCDEVGTYNIEVMANIKESNNFPNVKVVRKSPGKVKVRIIKVLDKKK